MRWQATKDLWARYRAVFAHAWQRRAAMEPIERPPHEAQFLPAALSLEETPLSPAPHIAMWLLITFAVLTLLWAVFGQIDVVVTAEGKVVPTGRTKTIQPFETATVKRILVTDGQPVNAGELLIELDATTAQADTQRIENDLTAIHLQVARAQAMLTRVDTLGEAKLLRPPKVSDAQFTQAQHMLAGQVAEYHAKLARMDAEIARHEAEQQASLTLIAKLKKTVPIAQQRAEDFKTLFARQSASKHAYLDREQARIEQEGALANQQSQLKVLAASVREARGQRTAFIAETRRTLLDTLTQGQQQIAALEQELIKAQTRDHLMRLKSPVDGTVQQLAVHTLGGVVTPAQPLMVIVPRDNPLEIEAFVQNKDIGFVKPGQPAEIKIQTFQYTKYGTIDAKVTSVSYDAINDEQRGLIYSTRVSLDKTHIMVNGAEVKLRAGMAVSVEIKIDKRRVIEYFLSPLLRHASESLRER